MEFSNFSNINELHFEISSKCQLNCVHCSSYNTIHCNEGNEFEFEDLKRFLTLLPKNIHVYITGGEPLLSPRLQASLDFFNDIGYKIGLFSTFNIGKDVRSSLDYLKKNNLHDFYVSVYSDSPEIHDSITQVQGSWKNSIDAIKFARDYNISPKINFVLLKNNIKELSFILKNLDKLNADEIRILKLVKHGSAKNYWDKIGLSFEEQSTAVKNIISNRYSFHTKLTLSGFPNLHECRPFESSYRCGAGKTLLYIDNNGNIFPCASTKNNPDFLIGNIKNIENLRQISLITPPCLNK